MPSCKNELYKYRILNDTNFHSFCMEKRVGFLGVGLELGLWMGCCYYQIYFNRI